MPNNRPAVAMPVSKVSTRRTQVVGHRGAAGLAPENTLAAFEVAQALGLDGVEFDVQRTQDGHLIVIHDDEVNRTTDGMGIVRHLTLAQIKAMDAGIWFEPKFRGQRVPTLIELFDFMLGNDLLLFLEIKDPAHYPSIEAEIAALIRQYDFVERVCVRSFDSDSVRTFHQIAPEIAVSELWWQRLPDAEEIFAPTIDGLFSLFTAENIDEFHERGQKVTAWTVNGVEDAKNLMAWGLDGLVSDFPDRILGVIPD